MNRNRSLLYAAVISAFAGPVMLALGFVTVFLTGAFSVWFLVPMILLILAAAYLGVRLYALGAGHAGSFRARHAAVILAGGLFLSLLIFELITMANREWQLLASPFVAYPVLGLAFSGVAFLFLRLYGFFLARRAARAGG